MVGYKKKIVSNHLLNVQKSPENWLFWLLFLDFWQISAWIPQFHDIRQHSVQKIDENALKNIQTEPKKVMILTIIISCNAEDRVIFLLCFGDFWVHFVAEKRILAVKMLNFEWFPPKKPRNMRKIIEFCSFSGQNICFSKLVGTKNDRWLDNSYPTISYPTI